MSTRKGQPSGRRPPGQPDRPVRQREGAKSDVDVHEPDGVRLQKVLAGAGMGSRRSCEDLIADGRVTVGGHVVRELGVRVDPVTAVIHVDGIRVPLDTTLVTVALNKPAGVVSSMSDEQGRPDLSQYVADRTERLFHVGRLDEETEGLLLLTNDGDLAHGLTHPSGEVVKTYLAEVEGQVRPQLAKRLRAGVELDDGPVQVDRFQVVQLGYRSTLVEVDLHSGRNRVVRRLMDTVGHPVVRMVRTRFGPIRLGELRTGRTRVLSATEVGSLMSAAGL
ncbi:MAG: rRNA pseudouridine synthase [Micrococcales bacterium]|nr:rRNA pseudouridine synthase [Micrococcales bacterium]MCL2666649.1 rRNA pseudouridine synthase [Micrococcales bacterium]